MERQLFFQPHLTKLPDLDFLALPSEDFKASINDPRSTFDLAFRRSLSDHVGNDRYDLAGGEVESLKLRHPLKLDWFGFLTRDKDNSLSFFLSFS